MIPHARDKMKRKMILGDGKKSIETLRSTTRPVRQRGSNFSSKMSAEHFDAVKVINLLRFFNEETVIHTTQMMRSLLYCRLEQLSRRIQLSCC